MHVLLAAIFPVGRVSATLAQPVFFTAVRMTLAGILLLGYYLWRYKRFSERLKEAVVPLILFVITGIYITNVAEFWALQYVPAAKASFIYSISPFAAALFSYLMFQEKMTLGKLFGMAIGFVGFMLMIMHDAPGEVVYHSLGFLSWGEVALIAAAIATAYGWIIMRRKMIHGLLQPIEAIGISMLGGGVVCFVHSFITEQWNPLPIKEPWHIPELSLNIGIAVICSSVLGYALYTMLLRKYTATFLSFAGFVEPLSAALFGWLFLGETISKYFVISFILVLCGLYIFYMEELRQGYILK
jgi:drug/metabolite transporter (DMT)-like permease